MLHPRLTRLVVVMALLASVAGADRALGQDEPAGVGASEEALLVPAEAPSVAVEEAAEEAERIVVTATRTEQKVEDVPSSVTVITAGELARTQVKTVAEALREVPAVDVQRSGPAGGTTSVFIRGADSEHTLVLVDGMEMNDPISPSRGADLAHLTVDNIERIEVIRGPQSTLYGSDAIGGVINIITKKGEGEPGYFVSLDGGSYESLRLSAGARGASGDTDYSLTASHFMSEGFSAASEDDGNTERDACRNTTLSARIGAEAFGEPRLDFFLRYTGTSVEIDNGGGAGGDDPNNVLSTTQINAGGQVSFDDLGGNVHKLSLSLSSVRRENDNPVDADHPVDFVESIFQGQSAKLAYQGDFSIGSLHTVTCGVELEQERGSGDYYSEYFDAWAIPPGMAVVDTEFREKSASTGSLYVQDHVKTPEGLNAAIGARLDIQDSFGSSTTCRLALAQDVVPGSTRVRTTAGTGFKAPSLYQIYDASSGNPDLEAERSTSWDFGIEQKLPGGVGSVAVTYFESDCTNLIDWIWTGPGMYDGVFTNVDMAESKGVEVLVTMRLPGGFDVAASYTNTQARDAETDEPLPRRPEHKYALNATWRFVEKGTVTLRAMYVSDRPQSWGPVAEQYALMGLSAYYAITDNISVTGRIENLFDAEYEEVPGYGTPGRSFYLGVKASF